MSARRSVSICLCTYNGERYLPALLESLLLQTRLPDELVVCDDNSFDNSWSILTEYRSKAPFPVRVTRNEHRLGVSRNFERAVEQAGGDVIYVCDQDDVWLSNKIATMQAEFERRPTLMGAFHDSALIDGEGRRQRGTLWGQVCLSAEERGLIANGHGLTYLIRHPRVAGHALAVSAELKPLLLPFSSSAGYDNWMCRLASAYGEVLPIDSVLVEHRLHDGNAVGVWRSMSIRSRLKRSDMAASMYLDEAAGIQDLTARLSERLPEALSPEVRRFLHGKARHLEVRGQLGREGALSCSLGSRWRMVVHEWWQGNYGLYSNGLPSVVFDLCRASLKRR